MDNNYKKYEMAFLKGCALVLFLWITRTQMAHKTYYFFLLWNLFLAFVPFYLSNLLLQISHKKYWLWWPCFFAWLFFFPNAPYIITDLVHLDEKTNVPLWYDAVLLFVSALNGLWIGCMSLMQMEHVWRVKFPTIKARYFLAPVMLLSGFGVYLGRVLRFNSWDIIRQPRALAHITFQRVFFPWQHMYTWAITLVFATVLWVVYMQVKNLSGNKVAV